MKRLIFLPLILISINVYASALFMGEILTVGSDGAFDAARNPALMVWSKGSAFGLKGVFQAYRMPELILDCGSDTLTNVKINIEDNGTLNAGFSLSYLAKFEKSAFGFSIIQNNDFLYTSSDTRQKLTAMSGTDSIENTTEKSGTELNPAVVLAGGWKLSSKSSFGFSLNTGYSMKKSLDETKHTVSPTTADYVKNSNESYTSISSELSFGWSFIEGPVQVGASITSGKMVYRTGEYKSDFNNGIMYSFNGKTIDYYYNSMPVTSIGVHTKPFSRLAFAFETIYIFGGDWYEKEFEFESAFPALFEISKKTSISPAFVLKGGFEFFASEKFIISAGGFYSIYEVEKRNSGFMSDSDMTDITIIAGTAGFDLLFGNNSRFMLGAKVTSQRSEAKINKSNLYIKAKDETIFVDTWLGASFGF